MITFKELRLRALEVPPDEAFTLSYDEYAALHREVYVHRRELPFAKLQQIFDQGLLEGGSILGRKFTVEQK